MKLSPGPETPLLCADEAHRNDGVHDILTMSRLPGRVASHSGFIKTLQAMMQSSQRYIVHHVAEISWIVFELEAVFGTTYPTISLTKTCAVDGIHTGVQSDNRPVGCRSGGHREKES